MIASRSSGTGDSIIMPKRLKFTSRAPTTDTGTASVSTGMRGTRRRSSASGAETRTPLRGHGSSSTTRKP